MPPRVHASFGLDGCGLGGLGFQFHQYQLKGFIAHIFRQMFACVHPHGLPSLPTTLVRLAIWQGKFHLAVRQKDGDARGMPVHHGLLMGAVGDPQHPHLGILDLHFVVPRIDFHGVLREGRVGSYDYEDDGAQDAKKPMDAVVETVAGILDSI